MSTPVHPRPCGRPVDKVMKYMPSASSSKAVDASGNPVVVSPYHQSPLVQPPFAAAHAVHNASSLTLSYHQHDANGNPCLNPFSANFQHPATNGRHHLNASPPLNRTLASSVQTPTLPATANASSSPTLSHNHSPPSSTNMHSYEVSFQSNVPQRHQASAVSPTPSNHLPLTQPDVDSASIFVSNGASLPPGASNMDVSGPADDTHPDVNPSSPSPSTPETPSPYIPLQQLLHSINPYLMDDLKNDAPAILMELMKQDAAPNGAFNVNDPMSPMPTQSPTLPAAPANPQFQPSSHQPNRHHQRQRVHANNLPPGQANVQSARYADMTPPNGTVRPNRLHVQQPPPVGVLSPPTSISVTNDEPLSSSDAPVAAAVAAAAAAAAEAAAVAEAASRSGSPRNGARHSSPSRVRSKARVGEKRTKSRARDSSSSLSTVAAANRALKQEAQAMAMVQPVSRSPVSASPGLNVLEQPSPILNLRGVRISSSSSVVANPMMAAGQVSTAPNMSNSSIAVPTAMMVGNTRADERSMVDGGSGDAGSYGGGLDEKSMDGEEDVEVKKAMRAERNRQSAAASRERKKHHIKELERRVAVLSKENAQLQVDQLQTIHDRIEKERKLLEENKKLKRTVAFRDMEIQKLSRELEQHRIDEGPENSSLKRPSTWDVATFKVRNPLNKTGR